jgi:hypothetical protein
MQQGNYLRAPSDLAQIFDMGKPRYANNPWAHLTTKDKADDARFILYSNPRGDSWVGAAKHGINNNTTINYDMLCKRVSEMVTEDGETSRLFTKYRGTDIYQQYVSVLVAILKDLLEMHGIYTPTADIITPRGRQDPFHHIPPKTILLGGVFAKLFLTFLFTTLHTEESYALFYEVYETPIISDTVIIAAMLFIREALDECQQFVNCSYRVMTARFKSFIEGVQLNQRRFIEAHKERRKLPVEAILNDTLNLIAKHNFVVAFLPASKPAEIYFPITYTDLATHTIHPELQATTMRFLNLRDIRELPCMEWE